MPGGMILAFDKSACPLARGQTTSQDVSAHLGKTYVFYDSVSGHNNGAPQAFVLAKNVSTITLVGGKAVRWDTGEEYHTAVDGYTRIHTDAFAGIVDPALGTTGVAVDSYFLLQTYGPCLCKTPDTTAAASGPDDYTVGAKVSAATAAASTQTTDAGCVATRNATLGATGTEEAAWIENAIGRAASALATTNTGTDILVFLGL